MVSILRLFHPQILNFDPNFPGHPSTYMNGLDLWAVMYTGKYTTVPSILVGERRDSFITAKMISNSHDETLAEQHLGFVNLLFAKGW